MIAHGLNAVGALVAQGLNPGPRHYSPVVPSARCIAQGAALARVQAAAADVGMAIAQGSGVATASGVGAALVRGSARGTGIVQTHGRPAES